MGIHVVQRGILLVVAGLVAALLPVSGRAVAPAGTLGHFISQSLQNNGDLKSFRDEKGVRDAGKMRAGLLPNPTLEFEGGTVGSDESNLAIGISQEFLLAGKRDKRLTVAEREVETYRWQLAERERALAAEVKKAFYDALLAGQRLALADRFIVLNRQLLEVTRDRLAAGDIPELEMNLAKVELARSEGTRIEAERSLLQARAKLFAFTGLPASDAPVVAGTLDVGVPLSRNLAELKQLALGNRPDLKALATEKARGDAEVELARSEAIPNLTAGIFYAHERSTDATGSGEEKVRDNRLGIRFSLPIPLFDNNQHGIQEAQARRSSSESRLSAATQNVEREVEIAYASVLNADQVLALYTANIIPQLEENLQLTQEAYRLGEVGILVVIQEQKKFFEVSDGHLTALYARQLALVQLESAVATDLSGGVQ